MFPLSYNYTSYPEIEIDYDNNKFFFLVKLKLNPEPLY